MMRSGFAQVLGHYLDSIRHPLSPIHGAPAGPAGEFTSMSVDPYRQVVDVAAGRVGVGASVLAGAVAAATVGGCSQPRKLGPLTAAIC